MESEVENMFGESKTTQKSGPNKKQIVENLIKRNEVKKSADTTADGKSKEQVILPCVIIEEDNENENSMIENLNEPKAKIRVINDDLQANSMNPSFDNINHNTSNYSQYVPARVHQSEVIIPQDPNLQLMYQNLLQNQQLNKNSNNLIQHLEMLQRQLTSNGYGLPQNQIKEEFILQRHDPNPHMMYRELASQMQPQHTPQNESYEGTQMHAENTNFMYDSNGYQKTPQGNSNSISPQPQEQQKPIQLNIPAYTTEEELNMFNKPLKTEQPELVNTFLKKQEEYNILENSCEESERASEASKVSFQSCYNLSETSSDSSNSSLNASPQKGVPTFSERPDLKAPSVYKHNPFGMRSEHEGII